MSVVLDQPECGLLEYDMCTEDERISNLSSFSFLEDIDQIIIKENGQRLGEGKRYFIMDKGNDRLYEIYQDTPCQFSLRPPNGQTKLVDFILPVCTSCICPCEDSCRLKSKIIYRPTGVHIGYVEQTTKWWRPHFNVYNSSGEWILDINGSFSMMFFTIGRHLITNSNGVTVGDIQISYSQSNSTGLHDICLKFARDMEISTKLTLVGASLMFTNAQTNRV